MLLRILSLLMLLVCFHNNMFAQTAKEWFDKALNEKNLQKKIEYNTKAIELDPNYAYAYSNRGYAKNLQGDYMGALEDYNQAILLNPKNAIAYNGRGVSNKNLGNYKEAIANYNEALRLDANYIDVYGNRGKAKVIVQDYEGAIADYNEAIRLDPKNASHYLGRGWAKGEVEDYKRAILDYNKAIKLDPQYSAAYNNRGVAKKKLGQLLAAEKDYLKALEIDPGYTTAKNNLRRLRAKLAKTNPARIWVVSIGINQYQYEDYMSRLESPVENAFNFRSIFERRGVTEHQIPTLTNRKATRSNILSAMRNTFHSTKVGPNDMVVFYFSGHGVMVSNKMGICPYDYYELENIITDQDILGIMEASPARHKICFIEACKNDAGYASVIPEATLRAFHEKRKDIAAGVSYITSTEVGDYSRELPDVGGVFSYHLLNGIEQGDADKDQDSIITIKELFDYIEANVKRKTRGHQKPQINSAGYLDLPFIILK